jgi:hypothetical protein
MERLQRELHETQAELGLKEAEINDIRSQWRRAVSELNKLKVRGQVANQATDQEILDQVEQLRYAIRDFAFQHFEAELSEERIEAAFQTLRNKNRLRLPTHRLHDYLTSPIRRSLMIRSYVWLVLVENVSGLYYWCGSRTSEAMQTMEDLLRKLTYGIRLQSLTFEGFMPSLICLITTDPADDSSDPSNEEVQRWNNWRVMTTRLICDAKNGKVKTFNISHTRLFADLINAIYIPLRNLTRTPELDLRQHLAIIMRQFLDLDRILSMQVAKYSWENNSQGKTELFMESTMNLEQNEKPRKQAQRVALILAPGLKKYGNAYGADYDQSVQLLKMEVSCQMIRRSRKRQRERHKQSWSQNLLGKLLRSLCG